LWRHRPRSEHSHGSCNSHFRQLYGCQRLGQRLRALLEPTGNVHRSRGVRDDIRRGRSGQRHTGVGVHQAPEHAQRAQHVHTESGAG